MTKTIYLEKEAALIGRCFYILLPFENLTPIYAISGYKIRFLLHSYGVLARNGLDRAISAMTHNTGLIASYDKRGVLFKPGIQYEDVQSYIV